ncbi:MAG: YifB family Mg chelatase-like AAA ATPase [Chloroflexota bacterium]
MLARMLSASILGIDGVLVRVEVDVAFGLPGLTIVGLAGSAVLEARERVRSALRNGGFELPARRMTVNLAPADLKKEGTAHDLAIGIGILAASGQLKVQHEDVLLLGELALDGQLQPIAGVIALVDAARGAGIREAIVPLANGGEAAVVHGVTVRPAATLGDAVAHLAGVRSLAAQQPARSAVSAPAGEIPDLEEVIGQSSARRAVELAMAGRHALALCGPPGVGKTLLLRAALGLLSPLGDDEAIEVSRIYSVAGLLDRRTPVTAARPVRAPHHTVSTQGLVGGGAQVRPGEASLAHRGVLLLDELLQFRADALEALRQPLELGSVTIARAEGALRLPARFQLLAAYNPCPCGWRNADGGNCSCEDGAARRYAARLSGPLRDRIDLFVTLGEAGFGARRTGSEPTRSVAARVCVAVERQAWRAGRPNAELSMSELLASGTEAGVAARLETFGRQLGVSRRRLVLALRVARTAADLEGVDRIAARHVQEALTYRPAKVAP